MPGLFSRIKTWVNGETLKAADQNAEFDNIINNFEPTKMDDHSPDVATMQQTRDPGEVGSENLATTTAEEIEGLRFAVTEVKGTTYWYESPATDLGTLTSSGATPENRVISGATLGTSNQPAFLIPDGTTNEVTLDADPDEFRVAIENSVTTFTSDVILGGLLTNSGTGANFQMTVNDTTLAGGEETKLKGEGTTELVCDGTGSEINAFHQKWAAFEVNGEYMLAYVKSSVGADTTLTHCLRGWFFNSTPDAVPRAAISDGDTLNLLQISWIFAENDGATLVAVGSEPVISATEPAGAADGTYWLNLTEQKWQVKISGAFQDSGRTLIGITLQNDTACVAARSFEFHKIFDKENNVTLVKKSDSVIRAEQYGGRINVYGQLWRFDHELVEWNTASDMDTGVSLSANTEYYLYAKDSCEPVISDIAPQNRKDLLGWYHTSNPWRCIGQFSTDGSSNVDEDTVKHYLEEGERWQDVDGSTGGIGGGTTIAGTLTVRNNQRRPIMLGLNPRPYAGQSSYVHVQSDVAGEAGFRVIIKRNGVDIGTTRYRFGNFNASSDLYLPVTPLMIDFEAPAGEIEYELSLTYEIGPGGVSGTVDCDFYALTL